MSTVPQERVSQLDFSQAVVGQALSEIRDAENLGAIKAIELPHIENRGLYGLWQGMIARVAEANDKAAEVQAELGFTLGSCVVRLAAGGELPWRNPDLVDQYYRQLRANPALLDKHFRRDFAGHTAVLSLVDEQLQHPRTKTQTTLVLNIFGDLANPDRPPFEFPQPRLKPSRRSSGQSFAVRGATHRR